MAETPAFDFIYDPCLADFAVSKQAYLAAHPDASFGYIATSTLVVDTETASNPRVLLIQRAADDEDPNLWEPPGGACDDEDTSILHAAARELWEEAGLQASEFCRKIGDPYFFTLDDGKKVCQFNFVAKVRTSSTELPTVKLDPNEHQQFVWASESEVKAGKAGGFSLDFTRDEVKRTALLALDQAETK